MIHCTVYFENAKATHLQNIISYKNISLCLFYGCRLRVHFGRFAYFSYISGCNFANTQLSLEIVFDFNPEEPDEQHDTKNTWLWAV